MSYTVSYRYFTWNGQEMAGKRIKPNAQSTSDLLTHLGRDGVRDITILGPDGVEVSEMDVIEAAAVEYREQQKNAD